jgi:hypothetical protein
MADIDWARMASPQADGYDTIVALRLASTTTSQLRPTTYRRAAAGGAPTLFNGRVAIRNRDAGGLPAPRFVIAPTNHPNLRAAEQLLLTWPEIAFQFPYLIDTIQPWIDTSRSAQEWREEPGSSSHSEDAEFGTIMVTVDSAIALAQAMVHEMAHHKLRALGVSFLEASQLITNSPNELYVSPIRTDCRRPMMAVLHAQYSFIHVTALDVAIHCASAPQSETRRLAEVLLARYLPRMIMGYNEIQKYARTDAAGDIFLGAFMAWSRSVIARGHDILAQAERARAATRQATVRRRRAFEA